MKYLGIDYGSARIGLAVSDDAGRIAFPRTEMPNDDMLVRNVIRTVKEERIGRVIVGDTRTVGGAANPITEDAQRFLDELAATLPIPVEFAREAWSSIEAARYAPPGQEHNNASAAAVILQRYLDMRENTVE